MPKMMPVSFDFADEWHDDVRLHWEPDSSCASRGPIIVQVGGYQPPPTRAHAPGAGWSVELPAVLLMLDAADRSGMSPGQVRSTLLAVLDKLTERSGCCPDCEAEVENHAAALAAYRDKMVEYEQRAAAMTGETHPFVIGPSGTVHEWNCRQAPEDHVPQHPGESVREYVHKGLRCHLDDYYPLTPPDGACRVTPEELAAWIRDRRGPKGGPNYRRCRICQPSLPVAYTSEAGDVG